MTFGIGSAYDIRVDDTFVMVGGYLTDYEGDGTEGYSDKLIKYLPENGGTFMELPSKMKLPRMGSTAILVDRSIYPSCTEPTTDDGQPEVTTDDGSDDSGALSVKSSIVLSSVIALIVYLQN